MQGFRLSRRASSSASFLSPAPPHLFLSLGISGVERREELILPKAGMVSSSARWEIDGVKAYSYQLIYRFTKSKDQTPTDFSCTGQNPTPGENFLLGWKVDGTGNSRIGQPDLGGG